MIFGKTEKRIILSKIISIDTPDWSETKILFTIAFDIMESTGKLFIVDLGCMITFSSTQQYRVVARSSIEIKGAEEISLPQLRAKSEEEIPGLEKLINENINKYSSDFKISHSAKPNFSVQEIESAINDVLKRESQ
ncbi:MAG TPA: hypothetical protein VFW07_12810 [Parafilimonas sp.]|nr:hypothetical protein [Parafilimonas sp.]